MPKGNQWAYAKLLKQVNDEVGDGLYYPTEEPRIGDVAYFDMGEYRTKFNAYQMNRVVRLSLTL